MKKLKKIVMIGPVYPYKGGIAHYTGLMYKALCKQYNVTMVSYSMQYPKLLFKKEQKDYSNDTFKIENTKYWINTANPFSCIAAAKKIKKIRPDLVIFQWWHPYFAPCYRIMEVVLGKDIKKLFVCHNVFPHERFPMDRSLTKMVLKHGDFFITQSKLDTKDLLSIKEKAVYKQTVHPTYNAFKIKDMSKEEARQELGIFNDQKILLFFGFVREYKGLKHIIRALPSILNKVDDLTLYIVGDFGEDKQSYLDLINEKNVAPAVKIVDGYVPDNEVEKYFASCDLVVLPYESATQSGIVQIAYGFEKPVIVTDVGGLPEVVDDGKTGYVVKQGDDRALANAIIKFFSQQKINDFTKHIQEEAYKFSWDRITEIIDNFIKK